MIKDFDKWNSEKKNINKKEVVIFAHPREIWWCSIGVNVGAEIDGKSENFERPVIVMRVYNKETLLVLPITTKEKNDSFHHKITTEQKTVWVKLTQVRVVSTKRLIRKIDTLGESEFEKLKEQWKKFI